MSGTRSATVEIEREVKIDKPTSTLWVYMVKGEERIPVHEVTWICENADGETEDDCWVGVYAAKPTKDEDDEFHHLHVTFDQVQVKTA